MGRTSPASAVAEFGALDAVTLGPPTGDVDEWWWWTPRVAAFPERMPYVVGGDLVAVVDQLLKQVYAPEPCLCLVQVW